MHPSISFCMIFLNSRHPSIPFIMVFLNLGGGHKTPRCTLCHCVPDLGGGGAQDTLLYHLSWCLWMLGNAKTPYHTLYHGVHKFSENHRACSDGTLQYHLSWCSMLRSKYQIIKGVWWLVASQFRENNVPVWHCQPRGVGGGGWVTSPFIS